VSHGGVGPVTINVIDNPAELNLDWQNFEQPSAAPAAVVANAAPSTSHTASLAIVPGKAARSNVSSLTVDQRGEGGRLRSRLSTRRSSMGRAETMVGGDTTRTDATA